MKDLVKRAGLEAAFQIDSAATSAEELGNPVYPPARRELARHGLSCAGKTARRLRREDYEGYDLLIGMDRANLRNMARICGGDPEGKLRLLLDFADRPKGPPAKSSKAISLGRGGARERARFSPQAETAHSGLCDDEVADPWYTGDFDATWRDVSQGCRGLLKALREGNV